MLKKPYSDISIVADSFNALYGESTPEQALRYANAFSKFKEMYGENSAYIASSSGRVELLGNHTDHNGGRVLSCAISLDTLAFFLPTDDDKVELFSEGYGKITVDINGSTLIKKGTTASLIKGVLKGFSDKNYNIGGFKAYVTSSVINGSGVSSSASFEVLICEILDFLYNENKISCEDKAIISQFAEREFFGKPCGLLDQTAIAYGGLNKLDFSNKDHIKAEKVNVDFNEYSLIIINTGSGHENLTEEYASIPREMKEVATAFNKERLIDLNEEEFYENAAVLKGLSDRAIGRAIHFFEENKRVDAAFDALKNGNFDLFLKCVKESGVSSFCKLQNCYVPWMKEQKVPRALFLTEKYLNGGANRVHGGGFGGTILNIVKNDNLKCFTEHATRFFGKENVIVLKVREKGSIIL